MTAPQPPAVHPGTGSIHSRETTQPRSTRTIETRHGDATVYWDGQEPDRAGYALRYRDALGGDEPLDAKTLDDAEAEARAFLIRRGLHA
jgi:hypothetical protein